MRSQDVRTKALIALAISVSQECDGCIAAHAHAAVRHGATPPEAAEAIGVTFVMNGGAHRPVPGDDVLRRVLAEGLVSRANEQAANMAAVINLARAVVVVWLLLLR